MQGDRKRLSMCLVASKSNKPRERPHKVKVIPYCNYEGDCVCHLNNLLLALKWNFTIREAFH